MMIPKRLPPRKVIGPVLADDAGADQRGRRSAMSASSPPSWCSGTPGPAGLDNHSRALHARCADRKKRMPILRYCTASPCARRHEEQLGEVALQAFPYAGFPPPSRRPDHAEVAKGSRRERPADRDRSLHPIAARWPASTRRECVGLSRKGIKVVDEMLDPQIGAWLKSLIGTGGFDGALARPPSTSFGAAWRGRPDAGAAQHGRARHPHRPGHQPDELRIHLATALKNADQGRGRRDPDPGDPLRRLPGGGGRPASGASYATPDPAGVSGSDRGPRSAAAAEVR